MDCVDNHLAATEFVNFLLRESVEIMETFSWGWECENGWFFQSQKGPKIPLQLRHYAEVVI